MQKNGLIKKLIDNKIYAVVRANSSQSAIDIAKALIDGGVKTIEISSTCPETHKAIDVIGQIDDVIVAAGSIITTEQSDYAIKSGADIIVSPMFENSVARLCKSYRVPYIATASTPTEAYNAWKYGVSMIKMFPIHVLGGTDFIENVKKSMPFLPLMATGGVTIDDFTSYLDAGVSAVGMGKCFYENDESFAQITQKAKLATTKLEEYLSSI